jgi:hypothetical protein
MAWPWTAAMLTMAGERSQPKPSWQEAIQSSNPGSAAGQRLLARHRFPAQQAQVDAGRE